MAKKRGKGSKTLKDSTIKNKTGVIKKNLILFAILFATSLILYYASNNEAYKNLFFILATIFGFIGTAFLISLLVYVFANYFKKK